MRKRETSSLAMFDHSCVRNALLEMVNRALKLSRGVLVLTGFFRGERLDFFKRGVIATGGRLSHQVTNPL
jgi:hypothetical protein